MKLQIVMLKSNNFSAQYRIYYEDTDAGGVVYYANYLKFFERARTDFLRNLKISQQELIAQENLAFVVRCCKIDYAKPARLDDLINISVMVEKIGAASIAMKQEMRRAGELLALLAVEIVAVNVSDFKPKKIPNYIRDLL